VSAQGDASDTTTDTAR